MSNNGLNNSYIRGKIDIAFARLIGPLAIMKELESYVSSQEKNAVNCNVYVKLF